MNLELQSSQCNKCGYIQSPTKVCPACKSSDVFTGVKQGWAVVIGAFGAIVGFLLLICLG